MLAAVSTSPFGRLYREKPMGSGLAMTHFSKGQRATASHRFPILIHCEEIVKEFDGIGESWGTAVNKGWEKRRDGVIELLVTPVR